MGEFNILDPNEVSCAFVGVPVVGGFADGTMVTVEMDDDAFGDKVGAMGDVTRFKKNNPMATITVRLMQTSKYNTVFSTLHALDQAAPNGAGVGPSSIKDLAGTSLYFFSKSWVAKAPTVNRGTDDNPMEWKFRAVLSERVD